MVDSKSYCTNAQTHRDQACQVSDLSLGLTTCDMERRSLARPPLARAQGWHNRVRPSPTLQFSGAFKFMFLHLAASKGPISNFIVTRTFNFGLDLADNPRRRNPTAQNGAIVVPNEGLPNRVGRPALGP